MPTHRTSGQRAPARENGRAPAPLKLQGRTNTDMVRHDREYVEAMAARREEWRARAQRTDLTELQRVYAMNRAEALTRGLRSRVRDCGKRNTLVKCACGSKLSPWRCQKALVCFACAAYRRWAIVERIEHAIRRQQAMVPGGRTLLLTLTAAHTVRRLGGRVLTAAEELQDLRERLADGWRAFSRALGKRYGFTPYVGVWEVTPGTSSRGHLHLHVVVQWDYRPWSEVAALWRASCPSSTRISIVQSFDDRRTAAARAAEYISKYIGKTRGRPGGRGPVGRWTPELHARVHAATYQLRWLFAARGHLPPAEGLCPKCGEHAEPCDKGRCWLWSHPLPVARDPVLDTPDWWDAVPWVQLPMLL